MLLPDLGLRAGFIFVSGHGLHDNTLKRYLKNFKDEFTSYFIDKFGSSITETDTTEFELIEPTLYSIYNSIKPKISLVGFDGVGKTTISQLIKNQNSLIENLPSMNSAVYTMDIGKLSFLIWDFISKQHTTTVWKTFLKDSEGVLLITDSTRDNVEKCKQFKHLILEEVPNACVSCIANKLDLVGVLSPGEIESILELKTYPLEATNPEGRNKLITSIAEIMGVNPEESPILIELKRKDLLLKEAHKAIEAGEFRVAVKRFEELARYCEKIEETELSKEYKERAEKLKVFIQSLPS